MSSVSRGVGMEQARAVEDLIGGIYDAAADPGLWSNAIGQIVEATGCRTGVFYEHDLATHQSQPLGFHEFNTEFMQEYVAHYGALDPWNSRKSSTGETRISPLMPTPWSVARFQTAFGPLMPP